MLESQHETAVKKLSLVWTQKAPPAKQEQHIADLEEMSATLEARRQAAISRPDFAQDINQVTEISKLDAALEEAHFELALALSTRKAGDVEVHLTLEATNKLLLVLREYKPSNRRGQRTGESSDVSDIRRLVRSLTSRRDRIYRLLNKKKSTESKGDSVRSLAREMLFKLGDIKSHVETIFQDEIAAAKDELTSLARDGLPSAAVEAAAAKTMELEREYEVLQSTDVSRLSEDEQVAHMIRQSELETILSRDAALLEMGNGNADDVAECQKHLDAIGERRLPLSDLPLGLVYPTASMDQQLLVLKNTLSLRWVASERSWEDEYRKMEDDLALEFDALEDELACEQTELMQIKGEHMSTEQREEFRRANEDRQARRERRRQFGLSQRQQSDRSLFQKNEKALAETRALRQRQSMVSTATAAAGGVGANASVMTFAAGGRGGGRHQSVAFTMGLQRMGDLRMCRMCRTGPIENQSCADLESHNDISTTYHGQRVGSRQDPNHCPNCGWFHPNWNQWPYWDGIYGPH